MTSTSDSTPQGPGSQMANGKAAMPEATNTNPSHLNTVRMARTVVRVASLVDGGVRALAAWPAK